MRRTDGPSGDRSIDTARTEALSDGVFAIAATLLVLNLEVPDLPRPDGSEAGGLSEAVANLAPSVLSYVLSFAVILAFWTSHRAIFRHVVHVDRPLSWLNGLFLLVVAFLPFSTGLFDRYAQEPLAVAVYVGSIVAARLAATAVWWYASARSDLVSNAVEPKHARFHRLRGLLISFLFLLSLGLAYVSVAAAAILWIALFVVDQALLHAFEPSR